MFDRFGEFDSAEELNKKADELKALGDTEGVYVLAAENGIDKEDAKDYLNGDASELATPMMAAAGKLKVESEHLGIGGILKDWKDSVMVSCVEDAQMRAAVRKKGKNLKGCIAELIKYSFENKVKVSDQIVDEVKVMHNGKTVPMRKPLYLGVPDRTQTKRLIEKYYMG